MVRYQNDLYMVTANAQQNSNHDNLEEFAFWIERTKFFLLVTALLNRLGCRRKRVSQYSRRDELDCILTGHTRECLEDASLYEAHKAAVKEVIEGKMMRIRSMSGLVELPRHILMEKIFEELYIKIKRKNGTWKK